MSMQHAEAAPRKNRHRVAHWSARACLAGGSLTLLLGLGGLLFATPVAGVPSGSESPPVPTSTSCSSATEATVPVNNTPVFFALGESCPFAPGTLVTITDGGQVADTITAPSSGTITLSLAAIDPSLSINGTPYRSASWGVNTLVASGLNTSGGTNSATFLIDLVQPSAPTAVLSSTSGGAGGSNAPAPGGASLANTSAGAAAASSSGAGSVGLAFTGANLVALIAAGLALLLLGGLIVIVTRRRAVEESLRHSRASVYEPVLYRSGPWRVKNIW
jgi:hypothetical protein